jgi:hypothetical protein
MQRRFVAMVRRGLSVPIHLCSVTDRVDKRLHIPVILLNNDPNNPCQTFVHPLGLFLFKSFVEHFYQYLTRNGSLAAMEPTTPRFSGYSSWRESFAPATLSFHRHGSRRRITEKLFGFGHFGIPFL